MATRLIGTDDANPRLPAVVITATQGTTAADLAPGDTLTNAKAYTDTAVGGFTGDVDAVQADIDAHEALTTTAHGGIIPPTALVSDGDLLTRATGIPAPVTRAALAADPAFVERFAGRPNLYLPGVTGNFVSAPDPPQLAGATQMDIRWIERPPVFGSSSVMLAQASSSVANTFSFLTTCATGTGSVNAWFATSPTVVPAVVSRVIRPTVGTLGACRITWRGSDGRLQFFTKATGTVAGMMDNTGWTQVGGDSVSGVGALIDVPQPVTVGAYSNGTTLAPYAFYAISLATTIDGTPFALWRSDPRDSDYVDAYGVQWTVVGTAWEWRGPDGIKISGPQDVAAEITAERERVQAYAATRPLLYLPGVGANFVSAPDPAALAGATALDVRWVEKAPPDTTQYNNGWLVSQAASTVSQAFLIQGGASVRTVSIYVANVGTAFSVSNIRPLANETMALRVTWRGSDGRVQMFTKPTASVGGMLDNTGWVQVGANGTLSTGVLPDVTHLLTIGANTSGSAPAAVRMLAVSVATAIDGTPFALWRSDPRDPAYRDAYGTQWTLNGTTWEWRDANGLKLGGPPQVLDPMPTLPMRAGYWHSPVMWATSADLAPANGVMYGTPLVVGPNRVPLEIACEIMAAGSAGALCRMGIYTPTPGDATGLKSDLVADAGTVDATTIGVKQLLVTVTPVPYTRILYLAVVNQGVPATVPKYRAGLGPLLLMNTYRSTVGTALSNVGTSSFYLGAGVTGALPAQTLTNGEATSWPRMAARF